MLSTLLPLLLVIAPEPQIGTCDPADGPPIEWSAEQRAAVKARVRAACRAMKAAKTTCEWLDAVGERESSWSPSVRHVRGKNESGLGALGLSLRWHRDKWPGDDEDPAFCSPEASVIVALDLVRRAQLHWSARNLVEVNAIFGGRFRCVDEGGQRECFILRDAARDRDICARLQLRGIDCRAELPAKAGGRRVPVHERPTLAAELAGRWAERHEAATITTSS